MKKAYLREVKTPKRFTDDISLTIFEGDIIKDKQYWKKYHNTSPRYFELKEVK